jgi:hypothetical protein
MPSFRKATTRTWGWTDRAWPLATGALLLAATLAMVAGMPAAEEPAVEPDKVAAFMRAKLGHAQNVLEGLTVEDFDLIDRGANDLALASQASSWQVLQTADYARHSDEFRRSCNALRTAAKARNLDGAALAWMEVTMKCIQCHKYVRDAERGR